MDLVYQKGYRVNNLDATLIMQKPRVRDYVPRMCENIAGFLKVKVDQISVKATTTEKLGFAGREEGIAAMAVVLLEKKTGSPN